MVEYKATNDRKQKKSTKIAATGVSVVLIIVGIFFLSIYTVIVGTIVLLASFVKKRAYVDETGVVVLYQLFKFNYKENWGFSEIKEMHEEIVPDPNFIALHFTKDVISKRLIFDSHEAKAIVVMAMEENPAIHFDTAY
jgi:hypothetical protein